MRNCCDRNSENLVEVLRVQSVDPKWATRGTFNLDGVFPVFIRSSSLKHLTSVVEQGVIPAQQALFDEYVIRQNFKAWLEQAHLSLLVFWFPVKHET